MFKVLIVAYGISCGADIGSTANALKAGGREALTPSQNMTAIVAVQGAELAGTAYALQRLHRTHPKLATAMTVGAIVFRGWAAQHNAAVARGR